MLGNQRTKHLKLQLIRVARLSYFEVRISNDSAAGASSFHDPCVAIGLSTSHFPLAKKQEGLPRQSSSPDAALKHSAPLARCTLRVGGAPGHPRAARVPQPGWVASSFGWHGDDGHVFHGYGYGEGSFRLPRFGAGDTVGCGMHFPTG